MGRGLCPDTHATKDVSYWSYVTVRMEMLGVEEEGG